MTAAAAVLVCALDLLGRAASSMPPIELVDTPPPETSPNANAFVRRGVSVIVVIASSPAVREARCGNRTSLLHLASVLAHEEWHVKHGSDERGAYDAQLMALMRLGAGPETRIYKRVYQSMRTVLGSRDTTALAAAGP